MKKIVFILTGLLSAIGASGADCSNNTPTKVVDQNEYTIVSDSSNNKPAVQVVGFWEFTRAHEKEYVVDIFFLATDHHDKNITHLYVHELIPPKDDWVFRFPEDLTACKAILNVTVCGTFEKPGDYTRRVGTGSGFMGTGANPPPACKSYKCCGHRDELTYDYGP
jgi:hypothetical protein